MSSAKTSGSIFCSFTHNYKKIRGVSANKKQLSLQMLATADISGLFFYLSKTGLIDLNIKPENRLNTLTWRTAIKDLSFYLKFF